MRRRCATIGVLLVVIQNVIDDNYLLILKELQCTYLMDDLTVVCS